MRRQPAARAEGRPARPLVVGADFRSVPAALRDRMFVEEAGLRPFLERLRSSGFDQAVLLSTCARIEVLAAHPDPGSARAPIAGLLAGRGGARAAEIARRLYDKTDAEAVRHLFRVASSLDSPVVGEPQVTGQVRASHRLSLDVGMVGPELESVLQASYAAARRVRNETGIGRRPVSLAAAALQLMREIHGDLSESAGLLILGGDMGEWIAGQARAAGLGRMVVTARVAAQAERAARRFGCHFAPIGTLPALLRRADVVVASLGTGRFAVTADSVDRALDARRRKPILLIDAAVPADVEPGVHRLDGAFVYDLDDLERIAETGRAARGAAARAAEEIVDREVESYLRGRAARDAAPAVAALRSRFEAVRAEVLDELGGAPADEATRRLIARLLHRPSCVLGELAAADRASSLAAERWLRRLFDLDGEAGPDEAGPGGEGGA